MDAKVQPQFTVAIDFGTSRTGYAYARNSVPNEIIYDQKLDGFHIKTRTNVLLNRDYQLVSFGNSALVDYMDILEKCEQDNYLYFERFKMCLYGENFSERPTLTASNGTPVPAITVFSNALEYIKNHVLHRLKTTYSSDIVLSDIQWVLTVPAIWSPGAKQFMREAALAAKMFEKERQLILALESEAAAIACRERYAVKDGTVYVVVDVGGGTCDVTVHKSCKDYVNEVVASSGGKWGSIYVDLEFIFFLHKVFGKNTIDEYQLTYTYDFFELMAEFEKLKHGMNPNNKKIQRLRFMPSFGSFIFNKKRKSVSEIIDTYFNDINNMIREGSYGGSKGNLAPVKLDVARSQTATFISGNLRMSHELCMSFFDPIIEQIITHIKSVVNSININSSKSNPIYMFMVGGFSESDVLFNAITAEFKNYNICVVRAPSPSNAILTGAVMFGIRPNIIASRIVTKSYGFAMSDRFDSKKHVGREPVHFMNDGKDVSYCSNLFDLVCKAGDEIKIGQKILKNYFPVRDGQEEMGLHIYSSPLRDINYTDDRFCSLVAVATIKMPDKTGNLSRKVEVSLEFGNTEILFNAIDKTSGRTCAMRLSFLDRTLNGSAVVVNEN